MSQVPARLVYTDSNNNQQVIGSFQPQDLTEGDISSFTLEEDAKNYKRVIIEGGPSLDENMPVLDSEFGTDEPEIRVQIDENGDGNYTERMRVYPAESGTTDNRGRYKNKNLWGFKRFYGEDDVIVSGIQTDIQDVLEKLLPDGYTAVYPSGESPPSVNNYSFNGSRQQAFNEIRKYYDHFIIFTSETDSNGDYEVLLQPTGFGPTQFSLVRGQNPLTYDYWKKNDLSNIISKVEVVGKNASSDRVIRRVAAGSSTGVHGDDDQVDVYLGSPEPDRKRFRRLQVDYTITESEADDIAQRIIDPKGRQQGKIETEIDVSSNLNDSVGIVDDDRNINDEFTVVKQKDYLHQGVSSYSFEFENEASQQQIDKWTEHDNERAELPFEDIDTADGVDVDGDTGNALSDTDVDGEVENGESDTDLDGSVDSDPADTDLDGKVETQEEANVEIVDSDSVSFNESIGNSEEQIASLSNISLDATYHIVGFSFSEDTDDKAVKAAIASNPGLNRWLQFVGRMDDVSASSFEQGGLGADNIAWLNEVTLAVDGNTAGQATEDYELRAIGSGATGTTVDGTFFALAISHDHQDTFVPEDNAHPHGDTFVTQDDPHPHDDTFVSGDDFHGGGTGDDQHGVDGDTDDIDFELERIDKVNRTDD